MPDISKLKDSPRIDPDTRWRSPSQGNPSRARPSRPATNALCEHVYARTQRLEPSQTLRIRDAIPHGDTERTDNLDSSEWGLYVQAIEECRPSIIRISKELGIMMPGFPGCPEDECKTRQLTSASQVMSRDNLQRHFGTYGVSIAPSLYSRLILAEDMMIVEGEGNESLRLHHQHLRDLRRDYGRGRDPTIDWNRPGESVDGTRLTLATIYDQMGGLVHQTVYVDPPPRISDAFTQETERERGRSAVVNLGVSRF